MFLLRYFPRLEIFLCNIRLPVRWLRYALVALCCLSDAAVGNPTGAQVASGSASITQSGNLLTVTNSPNAIINWQGFTINKNETIKFIQTPGCGAVLNQVRGTNPLITGALTSNTKVFITNPAGILFGTSAIFDMDASAPVASPSPCTPINTPSLGISSDMQVNTGWNLLGNSTDAPLDVASAIGDASKVNSVWKWIPATNKWAFYTPTQADGGAAYATSKGYDSLTTINGGEGFWVNATTSFVFALPIGNLLPASTIQTPPTPGWSMVTIGESNTPSQFNTAFGQAQAGASTTTPNFSALWAWDNAQSNWYFYAPSLEAQGGTVLADYIASRGYLDFTANNKTLGPAVGFWINSTGNPVGASGGATATVTLGNLNLTYNGTRQSASCDTTPTGLATALTYSDLGSGTGLRNAGRYGVTCTVIDAGYNGSASGTLVIAPANLAVSGITAGNKTYDGTAAATLNTAGVTIAGLFDGDSVTVNATGVFSDENAGIGKTVTVTSSYTGNDVGNYTITSQGITTANITPAALTITTNTGPKVYDGTTSATVNTADATYTGVVASTVNVTGIFSDSKNGDLPSSETVIAGTASISTSGTTMTIQNSDRAVINWPEFSIGAGATVNIVQPSAASTLLIRSTGTNLSQIKGKLQSNGRVFIVSPAGIYFGASAIVDVAELNASTLDLADQDFISNQLLFSSNAGQGGIANDGTITAATGGSVYLVSPHINNTGVISAAQGDILFAVGTSADLTTPTNPVVTGAAGAPASTAESSGQLLAQNGTIGLYGGIFNITGTLDAGNGSIIMSNISTVTAGSLNFTGTLNITGVFSNAGTLNVAGTVALGGTLTNTGTIIGGGTLNIAGATTLANSGTLTTAGAVVTFAGAGSTYWSDPAIWNYITPTIAATLITNAGSININSGGTPTLSDIFTNCGTVITNATAPVTATQSPSLQEH